MGAPIQPGGTSPVNTEICSMSIPLIVANFFQKYFVPKNRRGGAELLLKNVQ